MNFNGHCLTKNNISISKTVIISCTLRAQSKKLNTDITLINCLLGSVKLTKTVYLDKYKYTGYGMGIDSRSEFLFTDESYEKMSLFLELIGAHLCMLIIREKILKFLLKEQPKNEMIRH